MKFANERRVALALLAAVLIANGIGLAPELTISRVDLNDNAMHYPLIAGMVQAIERGNNPFDFWAPQWSLGYPVLRTYQPLGHAIVAGVYFALFKSVSLMTVFVWVRYLSVALLPLTFYLTARLLSLSPLTAAAAAMLSPLISTHALYGIEYGSYLWAGSGLFTQAIATHFALLSIGFAYRAIRRGQGLALTGLLVGLTFLAHFIYGYMAAITVCLLALMPDRGTPRAVRIGRTLWVGAIAFLVAGFELVPLLLDGSIINHSRFEEVWKWDSFGASQVLKWLFGGALLDYDRLPVLTFLVLVGVFVYFRDARGHRGKYPARLFIMLGAALWLLMFFGRPFWGPVLTIMGVSPDMQLHRVIGGAQIFMVLIAAIGLTAMWRWLSDRSHAAVAVIVTAILFYPMVRERGRYLENNGVWGRNSLAAYEANKPAIENAIAIAKERGGRVYAGLAASWGGKFKIGDPAVYAYFSEASMPALSFMYHSMSLTSEIMTRFNEGDAAQYRLFDVRTVVAPSNGTVGLPQFLSPLLKSGPLEIYAAPESSHFDVVDVFYAVKTTKDNFYDINDRWMASDWVGNRQHLLLDFGHDPVPQMPRLSPDDALPRSPAFPYAGVVTAEHHAGEAYDADIQAARSSYVLFKETWHQNWRATVDGAPVHTVMLSPGFTGVPVTAGRHQITLRYQPETAKAVFAVCGFLIALLLVAGERRGYLPEINLERLKPRFVTAAWARPVFGLLILALPVCVALLTSRLPLGHDTTEYLPRMVEFHQNISHGIWLPRWAPDLSNGTGQPLFLFNPPMFYYLAEFWHLLGFGFISAMNLACVVIVLASAAGMFLLGRLYFGEWGGWLAATAFLYAPYFAVDLYVRSAWAEFAAFPFFAFSLYGFGAYAKGRDRKDLLIGACAFAGILLSHNPAALLFAPVLVSFVALTAWNAKSWKILLSQGAGLALGLGLAAFVWIPSLFMQKFVQVSVLVDKSNYADHFVYLHQFFDSPWGYGLSLPGDQDGMSFSLGWGHIVLMIAVVFLAIRWRRSIEARWIWFFAAAVVVLCWMVTASSDWIWARIPMLQLVSFPWRWLGPIAVAVAALIAALAAMLPFLSRWKTAVFTAAMILLIVPNVGHFQPRRYADMDLRFWSPDEIARRGIEVTTFAEYRPRWMQTTPPFDPRPAEVVAGNAWVKQIERSPVFWSGEIHAATPATVEMSIAYFPGWTARVDGQVAVTSPSDNTGLIRFQVPAGDHQVIVAWNRTAPVWIADGISLLALALLITAAIPSRRADAPAPERVELAQMKT